MLRQTLEAGEAKRAGAPQPGGIEGDPGLIFSRINRSVRQAIAFKRKIIDDCRQRDSEVDAEADEADTEGEDDARDRQKRTVERLVTQAIEADGGTRDVSNLFSGLYDCLDDLDEYTDFGKRPFGAVGLRRPGGAYRPGACRR